MARSMAYKISNMHIDINMWNSTSGFIQFYESNRDQYYNRPCTITCS